MGVLLNKEIMVLQISWNLTTLASPYEKYAYDVLSSIEVVTYMLENDET
jgi:hypothetical protein